jgi:hypothetical protein
MSDCIGVQRNVLDLAAKITKLFGTTQKKDEKNTTMSKKKH